MSGMQRGADTPVLITEAEPSYDDQQAARRRKYAVMMAMRIPCLVLAVWVYQYTSIWWLALLILAVSIPLPWMAVLVANDRPPKKSEHVNRFRGRREQRALEDTDHQVIEGS